MEFREWNLFFIITFEKIWGFFFSYDFLFGYEITYKHSSIYKKIILGPLFIVYS